MSTKAALPCLAAGGLGLAAGVLALATGTPALGLLAGVLAIVAGLAGRQLGRLLDEQSAMQRLVEEELVSVRSSAKETESRLKEELQTTRSYFEELTDEDGYFDDGHDPLTDEATGLFSQDFFDVALDSRVAAARRHLRPVAVVLLQVVEGLPSDDPAAIDASVVANAIRTTLREADTACRLRNGDFALLLEDTPENGAIWTVERIRRFLAESNPKPTLWAGVACYPAHAFAPKELMHAATDALESAREWRQDRIEVALVASD
ncbi:MAG: GGDEF domain-containing protein [Acidimicrobiales bacterium]